MSELQRHASYASCFNKQAGPIFNQRGRYNSVDDHRDAGTKTAVLSASDVQTIVERVMPFKCDAIYGSFWNAVILKKRQACSGGFGRTAHWMARTRSPELNCLARQ
jgi:hypothetical protein